MADAKNCDKLVAVLEQQDIGKTMNRCHTQDSVNAAKRLWAFRQVT
mgnify:CR=1 FL=1